MAILADKSGLLGLKVALATNEHPHGVSSYFEVLIPVAFVSFANLVSSIDAFVYRSMAAVLSDFDFA
jgi:hypothetical protein